MANGNRLRKIGIYLIGLVVLSSTLFLVQHYRWNKEMKKCERALDEHLKYIQLDNSKD
jgi:hypothetical protein